MNRKLASKVSNFLLGNGFYIALTLCVCLITLSGYYLMSSLTYEDSSLVSANAQIEVPAPVTPAPVISSEKEEESKNEVESMGNQAPESLDRESEETTLAPEESQLTEEFSESGESGGAGEEGQATIGEESQETEGSDTSETSEILEEVEDVEESLEKETASLYLLPVSGTLIQAHSLEVLSYHPTFGDWRTHTGVDIATVENAPVVAIAAGHVSAVFSDDMMGTTVVLVHDNETESTYANLSENTAVEVGDSVLSGQMIGNVGNTAIAEANSPTHLQFSMTVSGVSVDPMEYLPPLH